MTNVSVLLFDLKTGRSSSTVQVRLLRFLEAMNVCRGGELMGVDMLLLDSQANYLTPLSAVKMHNQQEKMRGDPRVVVATSVNPKMVGEHLLPIHPVGHLFLNATSGTHIYFDKETAVGESFFYMLVAQDTGLTPATPRLRGYANVESLSIAELNNFVTTAPSQEIDFVCTGRVTGIKVEKGWCHVSHVCLATILMQLIYRVEMSVADETGEALFVSFDGVLTKLHNMGALYNLNK
ncbi:hypothetical protein IGI04_003489 [Brassica rapa subsp. trilocularis]|uniref:Cleavage/polyadenylation specificity factor A subunit C-terminal domain-containing protein n=1 Tax=Brassica rapa subsp. trilocularis TaxID=1813537 RepID=A0ABQ7NYK6_BRACM|nr:hypothetical protein IGI04_003489 [Brassica rapa subsp. trilocularis]